MSKYDYLKKEYPQSISKEQLFKICEIAKDTAWIYLNSGVIPCEDTGEKTRRYRIQIDDVIDFLEKRDKGQVPSRSDLKYLRPIKPKKLPEIKKTESYQKRIGRYFRSLLDGVADAIGPREMAEIVGLSQTVVQRHVLHGNIDAAVVGREYVISKESVLTFMLSDHYLDGRGCSEKYKHIMQKLSCIETELKQIRDIRCEVQKAFDGPALKVQLGKVIQFYTTKLKEFPEIMTVHDLKALFYKSDHYILPLLQKKKIRAAMVEGKYVIPKKSVVDFLEGPAFDAMTQFHYHLWIKMGTPIIQEDG